MNFGVDGNLLQATANIEVLQQQVKVAGAVGLASLALIGTALYFFGKGRNRAALAAGAGAGVCWWISHNQVKSILAARGEGS